jgi:hypothetical protein
MIWFWGAWGIFGVISVGLVTWTLITATLVLYRGAIGTWRSRVGAIFIGLAAVMFLIGIILVAKDRKLIEGTPTPADPTASAATPVSRITEEEQRRLFLARRQEMELPVQSADGISIKHAFNDTGTGKLTIHSGESTYTIPISKSGGTSVWIYGKESISKLFVVRAATDRGKIIDIRQLRVVKDAASIEIGDRAFAEMSDGKIIQLILVGVLYYGAGDDTDEARFKYKIYDSGNFLIPAL